MQEKVSITVVWYRQKFPSLRPHFGITRQSLVMPTGDPLDGNFCLYLTAMKLLRKRLWMDVQMYGQTDGLTPAGPLRDKLYLSVEPKTKVIQ